MAETRHRLVAMREDTKARFLAKVRKDSSGCWIWFGCTNKNDRPFFHFEGCAQYAYRVAWILFVGNIPEGYEVCHKCDVPNCVNPTHLFIGTHADNMADAGLKNRMPFGVRHHNHKLTLGQVREIRQNAESCRSLAQRFGVSHQMISLVRRGERRIKGV